MTSDEFRRYGRQVVDWIARYMDEVERYPVLSRAAPGSIRSRLPERAPAEPEPFDLILKDLDEVILPGITHWQSPNFFAYFPANASGPAILGELLSAGLGVQGMLWATSPACTELETHVLDWLVDLLGLPGGFRSTTAGGGVIQDTASSATLCALLAARERATGFAGNRRGVRERLTVYASSQAHSCTEKAVQIAGLGREQLRLIDVDDAFAMRPDRLEASIQADLAGGAQPCFVTATVGSTSSHAIDPLAALAPICRRHGVWLHVDAAMAGTAALCPEFRWIHQGLERADSFAFNPHKWMFVNFDCNCLYLADRQALVQTLSVLPEYLKNQATEAGKVIDYRDWQIPLGRRFRALKLWMTIRWFGQSGLQARVREHVRLAQEFARWVAADPRFELAAPHPLNLVCFRLRSGDAASQRLLNALNETGQVYLSHTRLDGKFTLRMSIGQTHTQERHVRAAWELIESLA